MKLHHHSWSPILQLTTTDNEVSFLYDTPRRRIAAAPAVPLYRRRPALLYRRTAGCIVSPYCGLYRIAAPLYHGPAVLPPRSAVRRPAMSPYRRPAISPYRRPAI